tara:strand:+ start:11989 stop:12372 length:384 start_codon:yes stop_codon:yes gene_type:complete
MVDKLDKVFEIVESPTTQERAVAPQTENTSNTDFQYTRENLYNIIERGQDAMEGLLQVAQETEHPRAYEVVGQLMDKLTNANKELINLHRQIKEIQKDDTVTPQNVTNALFVGSTAELQKMLKKKAK